MTLSSDLVSQFAKVTNDSGIKKEETILYGTVVQYNGSLCVQLDGSNEITPAVTTSSIKAGDRVSVSLKKHTAIITGNLSDPSASSDDVKKVKMEITDMGVVFSGLEDGTTIINGACIKTGTIDAERISLKGKFVYQYSVDGVSGDWHETETDADYFRRESIDGGSTWGAPYQFKGKNGANGSDANVPSYIKTFGLDFTELSGNYIYSPNIYGGTFYSKNGIDGGFVIKSESGSDMFRVYTDSGSGVNIGSDGDIVFVMPALLNGRLYVDDGNGNRKAVLLEGASITSTAVFA